MRRLLAVAAVVSMVAALTVSWRWAWAAALAAGAAWWALGGFARREEPRSDSSENAAGRDQAVDAFGEQREPWRLSIEDSLDLHAFAPGDIPDVTDEYLCQAHRLGFAEVRVIHGRGTGFQRDRVRSVLSRHSLVESFADAPPELGGWGATVVRFRRDLRQAARLKPVSASAIMVSQELDETSAGPRGPRKGGKMSTFVAELEPKELWRHFDKILTIPRGSKNEEAMARYVVSVAEKNGLPHRRDSTGNLVVSKPASPGREKAPTTVLQSHLDMVNEKNEDVAHDFAKDPLRPKKRDGYLTADGTTLGSDNGIGVAAELALMESDSVRHGPLEFLFTVDEETGLTGAAGLEADFLEGRRLINLDTEEEGALYVGCAGGAGVDIVLEPDRAAAPAGSTALKVRLAGLRGGHSGVDIHLQRGNAIKLLARALTAARSAAAFRLADIGGGNMHNAIPREAGATLVCDRASAAALRSALEREFARIGTEFAPAEPDLKGAVEETAAPERALSEESSRRVIGLLTSLPHGVISMSYDIPDLVETSSNLATARMEDGRLKIHVSNRSSVASALDALQKRVGAIAELAGGEVRFGEGYPGWKPDLKSRTLKAAREVYREHLGKEPVVKAVHAGLECGLIGEKYPGMDMVSLGPQIEFPHSPDERVKIDSVEEFYRLLCRTLEKLAEPDFA